MSKDFDIGFRVFCCLGFKKEFWFLFFLSLSVCVSSRGRAKRFVLEASSLRVRRAKKAEAEEPRRIVRALFVCVCVVATTVVVVFAIVYFLWSSSRRSTLPQSRIVLVSRENWIEFGETT